MNRYRHRWVKTSNIATGAIMRDVVMENVALRIRCLIILASLGVVTMQLSAGTPYKATEVKNGGTITGFVRLSGDPPKLLAFEITKDNDWCGRKKQSPRLVIGKRNGVRNAVVSLVNVEQGKRVETKKYLIDQRKCEYDPHILLMPSGSELQIVNNDATLHNVHAYANEQTLKTVFNIAQPIKGFRFTVKSDQLKTPGKYSLTCDAGHPWMSGYIVVMDHPYYAVTDADGNFVLSNIPPGTYKVKMWHEGVNVSRSEMESGKVKAYYFEPPYEETQEVTIGPETTVNINFAFALRPAPLTEK